MNIRSLFLKLLGVCVLGLTACSGEEELARMPAEPMPATLLPLQAELVWDHDGFVAPESAHYDAERRQIYVSNIGEGGPLDGARDGFLSLLAADGSVKQLRWIENLQAPKGLALCHGMLYVADLNEVLRIAVDSGQVEQSWAVEDAGFLNDAACGGGGADRMVYFSDMVKDRIYVVDDNGLGVWLEGPELENPNGLLGTEQGLLLASWGVMGGEGFATEVPGHLKQIDYATRRVTSLGDASPMGNLDGLEIGPRGNYLVSDWIAGKVFQVTPRGTRHVLLALEQGTADIGYIPNADILIVPLMKQGRVQGYRLH